MPFIPVPNTVSVELIYTQFAVIYENVFHVAKAAPFTLSEIQTLRAAIDAYDTSSLRTIRGVGASLVRIRIKALDSTSAPFEDFALTTPRLGTLAIGSLIPLNCCIAIKLSTGRTGRSFRGRIYHSSFGTTQMSGQDITTGYGTALLTAFNGFIPAVGSALGYSPGLVVTSYRTGGAWRAAGVNTAVTGFVLVDSHIDSQRRRLTGRGL